MEPIESFLSTYAAPASRDNRKHGVHLFLTMMYPDDPADYEEKAARYLAAETNHLHDMARFNTYMVEKGKSKLTRRNYVQAIKSFSMHHGHRIDAQDWKSQVLKKLAKGTRGATRETPLTHEVLREILAHAPLQLRVLVLCLCSSGMRLGEALQLKFSDVDLKVVPARVTVRASTTKTEDTRTTFLSAEAVEALRIWQGAIPPYLERAGKRYFHAGRIRDTDRVFPFGRETARTMWGDVLRRAGVKDEKDPATNRRRMRLHSCRRFFRTQLPLGGTPADVAEALMGHEEGLTVIYRTHSDADLAREYLKGEPAITIATASAGVRAQAAEVSTLRQENTRLQERLSVVEGAIQKEKEAQGSDLYKQILSQVRKDLGIKV
jgi:integrase